MSSIIKRRLSWLFFLPPLFVFLGCQKKVSIPEYLKEVSHNPELRREYISGDYKITCTYIPPEVLAISELSNAEGSLSENSILEEKERFSNGVYFNLRIGLTDSSDILKKGIVDRNQYVRRVNALTNDLRKAVFLIAGNGDTIKISNSIFERSYGASPDAVFMVAFPKERLENESAIKFIFDDKFFSIPNLVQFDFNLNYIDKELSSLKLNYEK
ncbi:hypothetical protein [Adhaeribacter soli]|uniref:Uncharacterized protein n=1 Tax=Adhaeribacter soli TaxID=2607655 RepID=A0A5N1IHP5_9BACT|nr:hypothetical protein [Adhaeribacter soli]KAA9324908.1 hypothetical protein F0P94_19475 [Adhaeribacter soli]